MKPADLAASPHEAVLIDYRRREASALAMGGAHKLERRKAAGVLNARERIAYLCDPGSFIESGLFGTSATNPAVHDQTPADGKITGFFVGGVMKATGGKADGKAVTALLQARKG